MMASRPKSLSGMTSRQQKRKQQQTRNPQQDKGTGYGLPSLPQVALGSIVAMTGGSGLYIASILSAPLPETKVPYMMLPLAHNNISSRPKYLRWRAIMQNYDELATRWSAIQAKIERANVVSTLRNQSVVAYLRRCNVPATRDSLVKQLANADRDIV